METKLLSFLRGSGPCCFWRIVLSSVVFFPILKSLGVPLTSLLVKVNATVARLVSGIEASPVLAVLNSGNDAKILSSVVESVAVQMIHVSVICCIRNQAVHQQSPHDYSTFPYVPPGVTVVKVP